MARFTRFDEDDGSFDREFWGAVGEQGIWDATWDMVEFWWRDQGRDPGELRLQRSVGGLQPARS